MSSKKPIEYRNYKQDLLNKKYLIEWNIKCLDKHVYSSMKMDIEWFEDYNKLNSLKIDLMTVKSRLRNMNKFVGGMEAYKIDINKQNTTK